MNLKQYFEATTQAEKEITETKQKLEQQLTSYHDMRAICTHNIIFKYQDNFPRKAQLDGNYYCPACRLVISCAESKQLAQTKFRESRVIPLLNYSLRNGIIVQDAIREEVYDNLEFYYNPEVPVEELSKKMESVVSEYHFDYLNQNKVLKNRKTKLIKRK